jgi:hypothetical protein
MRNKIRLLMLEDSPEDAELIRLIFYTLFPRRKQAIQGNMKG